MAVPVNATLHRQAPLKSGIILGVSPSSDPTFDVEIARATSGVYETIARLSPQGSGVPVSYTDILPVTTGVFAYKARAVKEGYEAGDYTAVVEVSPISLPEWKPNITPLTGKGIGAPLYMSTVVPPAFGSPAVSERYNKAISIYPVDFQPGSSTVGYSMSVSELYPTSTVSRVFYAKLEVPVGATSTDFSVTYHRPSTNGVFRVRIQTHNLIIGTVTLADYTATGLSTATKTFSSGITLGSNLMVRLDITSTNGLASGTRFRQAVVRYGQPTLSVSL